MGFFGDVGNALAGAFSALVTSVARAASYVYQGVKAVVVGGLTIIADKGHAFVDSVKRGWRKIHPHIENVVDPLIKAVKLLAVPFPKIHYALNLADRVVTAALVFAGTQLAHAVEAAIRWTIDLTKHIVDKYLRPESWHEAERHRKSLQEAADIPDLPDDERRATQAAAMVLELGLARAKAEKAFRDNSITNFDHYLRLRASAKLLEMSEKKIGELNAIESISNDDLLVVHLCHELVEEEPDVTPEELRELDRIVEERLGQKLLPFVFEELLLAWNDKIDDLGRAWHAADDARIANKTAYNKLRTQRRWGLTEARAAEMQEREAKMPALEEAMQAALDRKLEMEKYVHSAEGFLQFLEQPGDGLQEEGREELAPRVARIIIDCAQNGRAWSELSDADQQLIEQFALIYQKSFEDRMMRVRPAPPAEEPAPAPEAPPPPKTKKKKPNSRRRSPGQE